MPRGVKCGGCWIAGEFRGGVLHSLESDHHHSIALPPLQVGVISSLSRTWGLLACSVLLESAALVTISKSFQVLPKGKVKKFPGISEISVGFMPRVGAILFANMETLFSESQHGTVRAQRVSL